MGLYGSRRNSDCQVSVQILNRNGFVPDPDHSGIF